MGALGLDKESLADTQPYAGVIDQSVVLVDGDDAYWTLREFDSGDRFLQYSPQLEGESYSSQLVARLDGQAIKITSVYNDTINGGTFFDAVFVRDTEQIDLRKARWNDVILSYPRRDID